MAILALETSCDETSVAVLRQGMVTQLTASQIDVHRLTGGVVPEIAAREHVPVMMPLVQQVMTQANITATDIERIAVTTGPGLITSLMVGVETARTLAYAWDKPIFPINHIEGHIAANFLSGQAVAWPAVALVVSGGHTELLYVPQPGTYQLIGKTRDDAAGECFDKTARILGLPYPGGPAIAQQAATGDVTQYSFPTPMLDSPNFDFSFSGLKTAVLYFYRDHPAASIPNVCAAIEQAIITVLVAKTQRAVAQYQAKAVLVGGGVAANQLLRELLSSVGVPVYIPALEYCTDNAAMIAAACQWHNQPADLFSFSANPNWELTPR
ncbi:MAG: tRNA (adenosine(37)-N6)-threonylcarbamoyltransferase complex transferase subunit TsaD [Candidatus Kerfeldbacteria bacterium]|nr:tRNA (adenosine(37)-N6)-threonylcarbamoyltransferase complex transferase subunit TsaD [Candidatus Kerfeldbacteria bacterium]